MISTEMSFRYSNPQSSPNGQWEMEVLAKLDKFVRRVERNLSTVEKRLANLEATTGTAAGNNNVSELKNKNPYGPNRKSNLFHQLAESITAIAGLKEAVTSKSRPLRCVWALMFCLGVGATAFYLYSTTNEYLTKPAVTNAELVIEDKYEFPPLLLCSEAWFDTRKALDLGMSIDALKYSLSYLDDSFPSQLDDVDAARREFLSVYSARKFESLLDYYKAIANELVPTAASDNTTQSMYFCRGCANGANIDYTLLNQRFCYVFRLEPVEQLFGTYSGIRTITVKFKDRTMGLVPAVADWQLYFNTLSDAFIAIYPKVTVRPSYFNIITFKSKKMITLSRPKARCVDPKDSARYSSITCVTSCHNRLYKEFLNCTLLWLSLPSSKPSPFETCNHLDQLPEKNGSKNSTLTEFFYSDENAGIDATAADICVGGCPLECERTTLDVTLQLQEKLAHVTDRPSGAAMNGGDRSDNVTSTISVNVKHAAIYNGGVTVLTETRTYSFTKLVNNIGGTLGIFVGATVMTFAQAILFVIQYLLGENRLNTVANSGSI